MRSPSTDARRARLRSAVRSAGSCTTSTSNIASTSRVSSGLGATGEADDAGRFGAAGKDHCLPRRQPDERGHLTSTDDDGDLRVVVAAVDARVTDHQVFGDSADPVEQVTLGANSVEEPSASAVQIID